MTRILFMGTPEFAVVSLRRLTQERTVCGVFTQPDRPKNRGHKLVFSPVKEYALSQGLPVFQPSTLQDSETLVRSLAPDLIAVAAYGKLLPEAILNLPPMGAINVHSSLLPQYRGAAPINWAILNGETETGVTIMYMSKELDAGDILLQKTTPIGEKENAQELTVRLAELGAEALLETIRALEDGSAVRRPQNHDEQSYAPMLSRDLSPVDWTRPAHAIACQIRGLIPWPCATTDAIGGETLRIYAAEETLEKTSVPPGHVTAAGKQGIAIACGAGTVLRVTELQAPGGRRMSAGAYLLGHPVKVEES